MSDSRAVNVNYEEIKTELFRKSIHVMVALVPVFASVNIFITEAMLAASIVMYSICETLRINGRQIVFVSGITAAAARKRDEGGFVLGPVTLATGALLALMLYPSTAAAIAIYALAFGDSAASLVGKFIGKINLKGFENKTLEGSAACFGAVYLSTFMVTRDATASLFISAGATLIELVPVRDLDNLLIPVGTGMIAAALI